MHRYVTEYFQGYQRFVGTVDAIDESHASQLAAQLDPPQTVAGVLYAVVEAQHWTSADADRFVEQLAADDPAPPTVEELDCC